LCRVYHPPKTWLLNAADRCNGCPVRQKTDLSVCAGTPYYDADEAWLDGGYDSPQFQAAAALERDWLKALKAELEAKGSCNDSL
jgi:hypothetical protein